MLDKTDTRALRHADALCFDHLPDGTGRIRAILRSESSSTGFEQTHEIAARLSSVENYSSEEGPWSGYVHLNYPRHDAMAQTLIRRLRVGQEFALRWTRDNSSPVLREAGMVRDELRIAIGTDKAADVFLVSIAVGLDNTARMIRCAR